jgi:hypothetical protein
MDEHGNAYFEWGLPTGSFRQHLQQEQNFIEALSALSLGEIFCSNDSDSGDNAKKIIFYTGSPTKDQKAREKWGAVLDLEHAYYA